MTIKEKLNEVQRLLDKQKEHDAEFDRDSRKTGHSIKWGLRADVLLQEVTDELGLSRKNYPQDNCPDCAGGVPGKDALCDSCYQEYLGQHCGARGHGSND